MRRRIATLLLLSLIVASVDTQLHAQDAQPSAAVQVIVTATGQLADRVVTQTLLLDCKNDSVLWEIRSNGAISERSSEPLNLPSNRLEMFLAQLKQDLEPKKLMSFRDDDHTCRYTFTIIRNSRLEWTGSIGEGDFCYGLKSSRIMTPVLHAIQTKSMQRGSFLYYYFLSDYSFKYRARGIRSEKGDAGRQPSNSDSKEAEQSNAPKSPS